MAELPLPSPRVVLLAAPPVGVAAWSDVVSRLSHWGLTAEAVDLFDEGHADIIVREGIPGLVDTLTPTVRGTCLVAHGLANPLALQLADQAPVDRLVLTNGPLQTLDPITAAMSRLARSPTAFARSWARPAVARPLLASSLALRRLVVNPYVMDRDMVNRVTASWTADRTRRSAVVRWLRELPMLLESTRPPTADTVLVWGDEDVLYPAHVADIATGWGPHIRHHCVAGGRHLHPIERPWELADAVAGLYPTSPSPAAVA